MPCTAVMHSVQAPAKERSRTPSRSREFAPMIIYHRCDMDPKVRPRAARCRRGFACFGARAPVLAQTSCASGGGEPPGLGPGRVCVRVRARLLLWTDGRTDGQGSV